MSEKLLAAEPNSWVSNDRIVLYPQIVFALFLTAYLNVLHANGWALPNGAPIGSDFVSFWTAATESLSGNSLVPYFREQFEPIQAAQFPDSGYFAFFYPPHFLLYLRPLGLLPFYGALAVWMAVTFGLAVWLIAKITHTRWKAFFITLAFPASMLTFMHGQNAFLSAALFGGGLYLLDTRPVIAGILFGLLTYKPQLGLLIPFVLLAARMWVPFFSASITTLLLIAGSGLILGFDVWTTFITQSSYAVETMRVGLVGWEKMISPYAALRVVGLDDTVANLIHYAVAISTAAVVVIAWLPRFRVSASLRYCLILTGALLVTPFSLNYDLFVLAPALAFYGVSKAASELELYEKLVLGITYFAPLFVFLFMSNNIVVAPIFVALFFGMLAVRAWIESKSPAS